MKNDLILRSDVLAVVDEAYEYGDVIKRKDFDENNIPAADAALVKHGHWTSNGEWPCCSYCGEEADVDRFELESRGKVRPSESRFCPNCGAVMS